VAMASLLSEEASLAAIPDQVPVELTARYCLASVAILDLVVVELHRAQLDALPLVEESESVARFPAAERLEAQSRHYPVAILGQDDRGHSAILDQDDQETEATLDQADQEVWVSLDQVFQEVWVNHDQDGCPEVQSAYSDHRYNTKFQRVLMPYVYAFFIRGFFFRSFSIKAIQTM
jgi:hypothetical protein